EPIFEDVGFIEIEGAPLPVGSVADVADFKDGSTVQFALDADAPLLQVGSHQIRLHPEETAEEGLVGLVQNGIVSPQSREVSLVERGRSDLAQGGELRQHRGGSSDDSSAGIFAGVAADADTGAALVCARVHQGALVEHGHGIIRAYSGLRTAQQLVEEA